MKENDAPNARSDSKNELNELVKNPVFSMLIFIIALSALVLSVIALSTNNQDKNHPDFNKNNHCRTTMNTPNCLKLNDSDKNMRQKNMMKKKLRSGDKSPLTERGEARGPTERSKKGDFKKPGKKDFKNKVTPKDKDKKAEKK